MEELISKALKVVIYDKFDKLSSFLPKYIELAFLLDKHRGYR